MSESNDYVPIGGLTRAEYEEALREGQRLVDVFHATQQRADEILERAAAEIEGLFGWEMARLAAQVRSLKGTHAGTD